MNIKSHFKFSYVCLLLGIIIRLSFLFYGSEIYYGQTIYTTDDTDSYTKSFINLIENGEYTYDKNIPDAYVGRLPGYPIFFGIHYLIFGAKYAYYAMGVTQILLDTLAIYLIFLITLKISKNQLAANIACLIYACYPFIIVTTTVIASELLANFLIILLLYILIVKEDSRFYYAKIGILIAMIFFTREFLGIILPIILLYLSIRNWNKGPGFIIRTNSILVFFFVCIYISWPLRNYFFQNRILLIKPATAGYANSTEDVESYFHWVHCWSNDNLKWIGKVTTEEKIKFPSEIFDRPEDEKLADSLIQMCRHCSSGFYRRKYNENFQGKNCNHAISEGFKYLKKEYVKNHFFTYLFKVPMLNYYKAFFKNNLEEKTRSNINILINLLFIYRSFLLILGVLGLILYFRNIELFPIAMTFIIIYFFICSVHRWLEMRYLIQADTIMIIPAAMLLEKIFTRLKKSLLRQDNSLLS